MARPTVLLGDDEGAERALRRQIYFAEPNSGRLTGRPVRDTRVAPTRAMPLPKLSARLDKISQVREEPLLRLAQKRGEVAASAVGAAGRGSNSALRSHLQFASTMRQTSAPPPGGRPSTAAPDYSTPRFESKQQWRQLAGFGNTKRHRDTPRVTAAIADKLVRQGTGYFAERQQMGFKDLGRGPGFGLGRGSKTATPSASRPPPTSVQQQQQQQQQQLDDRRRRRTAGGPPGAKGDDFSRFEAWKHVRERQQRASRGEGAGVEAAAAVSTRSGAENKPPLLQPRATRRKATAASSTGQDTGTRQRQSIKTARSSASLGSSRSVGTASSSRSSVVLGRSTRSITARSTMSTARQTARTDQARPWSSREHRLEQRKQRWRDERW